MLARFCGTVILNIPSDIGLSIRPCLVKAASLLDHLKSMCLRINPAIQIVTGREPHPRPRATIAIGFDNENIGRTVSINSDGWLAYVDTEGNSLNWTTHNANPTGALVAACFGAAEVFKLLFLGKTQCTLNPVGSLVFSALDYGFRHGSVISPPLPQSIDIGIVHLISMGAINSAVLYALCSLPNAKGKLVVVEPQNLDVSNLNRYVIALSHGAVQGLPKISVAKAVAEPLFEVEALKQTYGDYRRSMSSPRMDMAVVGLDNNPGRWEVQEDLPRVLLCGGTEMSQITISRHDDVLGKACLGCLYPNLPGTAPAQPVPESLVPSISFVSALAGVLIAGEIIKERIETLCAYALDARLDLDVLSMPHFQVMKPNKSPYCGCDCRKWLLA